jgi:hypothetical protein
MQEKQENKQAFTIDHKTVDSICYKGQQAVNISFDRLGALLHAAVDTLETHEKTIADLKNNLENKDIEMSGLLLKLEHPEVAKAVKKLDAELEESLNECISDSSDPNIGSTSPYTIMHRVGLDTQRKAIKDAKLKVENSNEDVISSDKTTDSSNVPDKPKIPNFDTQAKEYRL